MYLLPPLVDGLCFTISENSPLLGLVVGSSLGNRQADKRIQNSCRL